MIPVRLITTTTTTTTTTHGSDERVIGADAYDHLSTSRLELIILLDVTRQMGLAATGLDERMRGETGHVLKQSEGEEEERWWWREEWRMTYREGTRHCRMVGKTLSW